MSAPVPGSRHTSCLTPAVEKVLDWHRQRRSFSLSTFDEGAMSAEPTLEARSDADPAESVWAPTGDPTGARGQVPEARRPGASAA